MTLPEFGITPGSNYRFVIFSNEVYMSQIIKKINAIIREKWNCEKNIVYI